MKRFDFIKSPLNYVGGKFKLLDKIFPHFPKINTFVDLFAGGGNVGINVHAKNIILNDIQKEVIEIFEVMEKISIEDLIEDIESIIEKYSLSKQNREGYLSLRKDYNSSRDNSLLLLVLIFHSFSNNIRFSNKSGFNVPFGKRTFNIAIRENLIKFSIALKEKNIILQSKDFEEVLSENNFSKDDLIFCDPPYLITDANYNKFWSVEKEISFLRHLEDLHLNGIKFILTNVIFSKGKENPFLKEFIKKYDFYQEDLKNTFNNSSHNCNKGETLEVLVKNF